MTEVVYTNEGANITVLNGDCVEAMRTLGTASVDAVVTDPPYGLDFMGREWDSPAAMVGYITAGEQNPTGGALPSGPGTHSRGFYNHDGARFEEWCRIWAEEAYRVLKPGGHILAFGGSRTWHRLAAGIEDAGFEIRDSIAWLYGNGFPKSLDVSKAVDKIDAAAERRRRALAFTQWMRTTGLNAATINAATGTAMGSHYLTDREQPHIATPELFDVLRPILPKVPAHIEDLVADRVVESENYAARPVTGMHENPAAAQVWRENVLGDEARPAQERRDVPYTEEAQKWAGWGTALKPAFEPIVVGRKPLAGTVAKNVLEHGTGALNIDANRKAWGAEGDKSAARKAAGYTDAAKHALGGLAAEENAAGFSGEVVGTDSDKGRWPTNVILDEAAAAEVDRQAPNAGGASPASGPTRSGPSKSGSMSGAFNGTDGPAPFYGGKGGASAFFPTFRYEPKAPKHERPKVDGVAHETVKPLDLMQWLVRLVTPKGGVVLEPFAGSGTTIEACIREGFGCIAIERDPKYLPLILWRVRKDHAQGLDLGDWEAEA